MYSDAMQQPIKSGTRVVVYGNTQSYANARVAECVYSTSEARWAIILEWPDAPGGRQVSRVWDTDEGKVWYRYDNAS